MPSIYFEDLEPGRTITYGATPVTEDGIVAFARLYDAQPFHLSEETARDTFVGRLIASGWHTIAMQMRMLCDAWLLDAAGMGSPGVEDLAWLKPVLPGDVLSVRETILDAKASRSRPGMGIVRFRFETLNAAGDVVMRQINPVMFERRDGPRAADAPPKPRASAAASETPGPGTEWLGEHHFEADDIVRFASQFDPQPFHLSDEAASRSHFGRLAASGWHTAAAWMSGLVAHRHGASGDPAPRPVYGPSPGFKDLRWLRPVLAGDTIRFATTPVSQRESASRPGWALSFSHNIGWNQDGVKVFEFSGSGFVRTTPD